ncbi:acyl-CoA dehydrogenase family member enigma [Rhodnius prolixus]
MAYKGCSFSKFILRNVHNHIVRKTHSDVAPVSNATIGIKTKAKKDPFMKNVFLGIVDKDILQFPEVEIIEDNVQTGIQQQIHTKAISVEEDSFTKILRSGICRLGFPETYGGLPCPSTRLLKEIEQLEISPPLACLVEAQYSLIIENIVNYGSDLQKKKYLSDLMSGTAIGAYAVEEEGAGIDPSSIRFKAIANVYSETPSYTLNGEKNWIINANKAKLFLVLTQVQDTNRETDLGSLTAFLVDRDTPGITVSKQKNLTSEYDICRVKFDQVVVPEESLLGGIGDGCKIAVTSLETNKFIFAISTLNLIRKLAKQATIQICQTNSFPIPLKDFEFVQCRISKIIMTLYALESSMYLLAGMKDSYEMDTALESVIFQNLIYSYGFNAINECINLFDNRALDISFKSDIDYLFLLSRSFVSPEMLKFYITLKGLQHAGSYYANIVKKSRNPLNFPGFVLRRMWELRGQTVDSPKLDKKLYMELHPSLKMNADQLEYCVYRLQYGIDNLLTVHGAEVVQRQLDLVRLTEVASDIFTMFAVLSRASRSYCTGIRFYDQEVIVANAWCQAAMKRVKKNISEVVGSKNNINDLTVIKLAPDIFEQKGYFFACPTEKNIH